MDKKETYQISTFCKIEDSVKQAVSGSYNSREEAENAIPSHIQLLKEGKDNVEILDVSVIKNSDDKS